jgi:hypothetical protein
MDFEVAQTPMPAEYAEMKVFAFAPSKCVIFGVIFQVPSVYKHLPNL